MGPLRNGVLLLLDAAYKKIHYVRRPIITCEMPSWLLYFFFNIINGVYFNIIIRVQRTGADKIN
jgi:hypothetical protein